jgi:hypothetical protein
VWRDMHATVHESQIPVRKERKLGGRGGQRNNICGFRGSQAVIASPSGRGEACVRDKFNFNFNKVGEAELGRNLV